jgi:hypothetical protein
MDVLKALRELYAEKARIDQLIGICEFKIKEQERRLTRSKRGRKSMSADERKVVSERMRTYWAKRREPDEGAATGNDPAQSDEASQPAEQPLLKAAASS